MRLVSSRLSLVVRRRRSRRAGGSTNTIAPQTTLIDCCFHATLSLPRPLSCLLGKWSSGTYGSRSEAFAVLEASLQFEVCFLCTDSCEGRQLLVEPLRCGRQEQGQSSRQVW